MSFLHFFHCNSREKLLLINAFPSCRVYDNLRYAFDMKRQSSRFNLDNYIAYLLDTIP